MTPESDTTFSLLLFFTLSALLFWLDRRHRLSRQVRQIATVALRSGNQPAFRLRLVYRPGFVSSRSARNQSSQGEPPWNPRASQ
jgi:hypothetical protein